MTMTGGSALVIRGNALHLPLPDESVDLIVTSPPYFALRSYRDGDEHYDGQIGSEPTPQAFLEALWACTAEWWRVLKPTGSLFVNLGDKRAGSGGHNNAMGSGGPITLRGQGGPKLQRQAASAHLDRANRSTRRNTPDRYNQAAFGRTKSKMLLPHRYAIGCEDGLADPEGIGWVVRQDQVWHKLNGLPESTGDRTRDQHEYWFHLTKQGRYYSAIDELREATIHPPNGATFGGVNKGVVLNGQGHNTVGSNTYDEVNPLGKLPGSVTAMSSEPLRVPEYLLEWEGGHRLCRPPEAWALCERLYSEGVQPVMARAVDHFAAFPQEWPRRLILGWSPSAICTVCGEGRWPVIESQLMQSGHTNRRNGSGKRDRNEWDANDRGFNGSGYPTGSTAATISGYACACTPFVDVTRLGVSNGAQNKDPRHAAWDGADTGRREVTDRKYLLAGWAPPPDRPSIVLDPFGGTGTTAGVARTLGRIGVSVDLSWDYCRLGAWRIHRSGHFAKSEQRTWAERQGTFDFDAPDDFDYAAHGNECPCRECRPTATVPTGSYL